MMICFCRPPSLHLLPDAQSFFSPTPRHPFCLSYFLAISALNSFRLDASYVSSTIAMHLHRNAVQCIDGLRQQQPLWASIRHSGQLCFPSNAHFDRHAHSPFHLLFAAIPLSLSITPGTSEQLPTAGRQPPSSRISSQDNLSTLPRLAKRGIISGPGNDNRNRESRSPPTTPFIYPSSKPPSVSRASCSNVLVGTSIVHAGILEFWEEMARVLKR